MINAFKSIIAGMKGGLAQSHLARGNYQKALSQIDSAISLDNNAESNPVYMAIKGKCHFFLNEKSLAKSYLEKAEYLLVPLLNGNKAEYVLQELSKIKRYIEKCD